MFFELSEKSLPDLSILVLSNDIERHLINEHSARQLAKALTLKIEERFCKPCHLDPTGHCIVEEQYNVCQNPERPVKNTFMCWRDGILYTPKAGPMVKRDKDEDEKNTLSSSNGGRLTRTN